MVDRIGKQSLSNSLSFLVFVNKSKKLYLIKQNISKSMSFFNALASLQVYGSRVFKGGPSVSNKLTKFRSFFFQKKYEKEKIEIDRNL